MKKPAIRNVTIQPGTHKLLLAEKRRTGINIKTIVDQAIRQRCQNGLIFDNPPKKASA